MSEADAKEADIPLLTKHLNKKGSRIHSFVPNKGLAVENSTTDFDVIPIRVAPPTPETATPLLIHQPVAPGKFKARTFSWF